MQIKPRCGNPIPGVERYPSSTLLVTTCPCAQLDHGGLHYNTLNSIIPFLAPCPQTAVLSADMGFPPTILKPTVVLGHPCPGRLVCSERNDSSSLRREF